MNESRCHACGAPVNQPEGRGRRRKWCSERCRKTQYSGTCIDCGAQLSGSDGRGPNAPTRCWVCNGASGIAAAGIKAKTAPRRDAMIARWNDGCRTEQIAAEFDLAPRTVSSLMSTWRKRGYPVAHRYKMDDGRRVAA